MAINVSIVVDPCRAARAAADRNGHPAKKTTGVVRAQASGLLHAASGAANVSHSTTAVKGAATASLTP
jgi:hypothetical protein